MTMRLITLCLPEPWIQALDALVTKKLYPNRSEAIRFAVHDLIRLDIPTVQAQTKHHRGGIQKVKNHRNLEPICSWCGKPSEGHSGYIVFDDMSEELAYTCLKQEPREQHLVNPLFESLEAYNNWKEVHPIKSRTVRFQQAIFKLRSR